MRKRGQVRGGVIYGVMDAAMVLGPVEAEFRDAEIPDWRLRDRLVVLSRSLDRAPKERMPRATGNQAGREAAYRFLGNPRVTLPAILEPHVRATVKRCRDVGAVYVLSDSTEFSFEENGAEDLGTLRGERRGFIGHVALAVSADGRRVPLGVLGIEQLVPSGDRKVRKNNHQGKKDPTRKSLKWGRMVEHTSERLGDVPAIHVMDSEADIFELIVEMTRRNRRYIIRAGQDRAVESGEHLSEAIERAPVMLEREVQLSRRKPHENETNQRRRNQPRQARLASLVVSSRHLQLRRPKTSSGDYPAFVSVNVVRVVEPSPPQGQLPVEWVLLTSEPVETTEDVAKVVDGYRARWLIEEYFKALKTGCGYESRQHESLRALSNLLAILAVIAYRLLLLRSLQRTAPDTPGNEVFAPLMLEALAALLRKNREPKALPPNPTVADVFTAIARLGAHITSNGPPGWQVLWRGYQDLLTWGGGYIQAKSITSSDPW